MIHSLRDNVIHDSFTFITFFSRYSWFKIFFHPRKYITTLIEDFAIDVLTRAFFERSLFKEQLSLIVELFLLYSKSEWVCVCCKGNELTLVYLLAPAG